MTDSSRSDAALMAASGRATSISFFLVSDDSIRISVPLSRTTQDEPVGFDDLVKIEAIHIRDHPLRGGLSSRSLGRCRHIANCRKRSTVQSLPRRR